MEAWQRTFLFLIYMYIRQYDPVCAICYRMVTAQCSRSQVEKADPRMADVRCKTFCFRAWNVTTKRRVRHLVEFLVCNQPKQQAKTVSDNRAASQTTQTRESDNTDVWVRHQKRASMTTKDNEGNGFTRANCKQQQKQEHGINKACGTAVGTLVTCDPIIRSLATLFI